jgi:hypothetical protein
MNLVHKDTIDAPDTFFTPLKHLTFEECNIGVSALEALLKLPTALETLNLGIADNIKFPGGLCLHSR